MKCFERPHYWGQVLFEFVLEIEISKAKLFQELTFFCFDCHVYLLTVNIQAFVPWLQSILGE